MRKARRVAGEWDPARDAAAGEACRAYGAPALMRLPGRLHITWQDDRTLKIDGTRALRRGCCTSAALRAQRPAIARGRGSIGRVGCRAGRRSGRAALGLAACGDHATPAGLPAQERRSVQREYRAHRGPRPASRSARCDWITITTIVNDPSTSGRNSSPTPISGKSRTPRSGARRRAEATDSLIPARPCPLYSTSTTGGVPQRMK